MGEGAKTSLFLCEATALTYESQGRLRRYAPYKGLRPLRRFAAMLEELKAQGKRLTTLENRDGEMWRKAVGYVVTTIIGIVVGYIFTQLKMKGA